MSIARQCCSYMRKLMRRFSSKENSSAYMRSITIQQRFGYVRTTVEDVVSEVTETTDLQRACANIGGMSEKVAISLFGDSSSDSILQTAKTTAAQRVREEVITSTTNRLLQNRNEGRVDAVLDQLCGELTSEILFLAWQAKQKLEPVKYAAFISKLRAHIEEGALGPQLRSTITGELQYAKKEVMDKCSEFCINAQTQYRSGVTSISFGLDVIVSIGGYIDAEKLLLGSDRTRERSVRKRVAGLLSSVRTWATQKYGLTNPDGKKTAFNEHPEGDELELVEWFKRFIEEACLCSTRSAFSKLTDCGIESIHAVKSEVERQEKARQRTTNEFQQPSLSKLGLVASDIPSLSNACVYHRTLPSRLETET